MTARHPVEHEVSASLKRLFPDDDGVQLSFRPEPATGRHRRTVLVVASVAATALIVISAALLRPSADMGVASGGRTFPLASNGWTPEMPALLAGSVGPFNAAPGTRPGVVCAWIGPADDPRPTLWPKGWRVRLHPVQLIDPNGHVFADAGDTISSAGGIISDKSEVPGCGPPNSQTASLMLVHRGR